MADVLELRRLSPDLAPALGHFFRDCRLADDEDYFHPHPLTDAEAYRLSNYVGADLYYVLVVGMRVIGYGMLRGWDEGFDVPSLGIALHPTVRGKGFGKLLMHFLHLAAETKGASRVRLKVHPQNTSAVELYRSLGYRFSSTGDESELVGHIDL